MLIRVVVLFLVFMLAMGMIQKALRSRGRQIGRNPRRSALDRLRCPTCKRITLTDQPAPCGRPDCGIR